METLLHRREAYDAGGDARNISGVLFATKDRPGTDHTSVRYANQVGRSPRPSKLGQTISLLGRGQAISLPIALFPKRPPAMAPRIVRTRHAVAI